MGAHGPADDGGPQGGGQLKVAIVHDYLTQRGGAERVALSMTKAFPGAPLHTSLYDPGGTFEGFRRADVRTMGLNRVAVLRRHHRLALPLLGPAFSRLNVDADVVICSSSGWAHGARTAGRKIVYCYTPARWLYQPDVYLGGSSILGRAALAALRPWLVRWDRRAAASAHRYLAISTAVRDRIRAVYGIDADIVPAPHAIDPSDPSSPVPGLEPGFFLCVSRLLPYKNVTAAAEAFRQLPDAVLAVVGRGPERRSVARSAPPNVRLLGAVTDASLRWLYEHCAGVVAASYEDYGLSPLEGAAFGRPAAVLRWGGYLDTVREHETGVFFDRPEPAAIAAAVRQLLDGHFDPARLRAHAARHAEPAFVATLRTVVDEVMGT